MNSDKGFNSILRSIGKSLEKEYKTDGGKANMQLVILLTIILVIALSTDIAEYVTNFFLALCNRPTITFLAPWVLPACFVTFIGTGIWCVSRVSKIEIKQDND